MGKGEIAFRRVTPSLASSQWDCKRADNVVMPISQFTHIFQVALLNGISCLNEKYNWSIADRQDGWKKWCQVL